MRSTGRKLSAFMRDTRGLATIEWVMISAVVIVASIAVTSFVMNGAGKLGESVVEKLESQIQDDGGGGGGRGR